MSYQQITSGERYIISALRKQGRNPSQIAEFLGRHRTTISREIERNSSKTGCYRPSKAQEKTNGRRSRSRRNMQFTVTQMNKVIRLLKKDWSPEQISWVLALTGDLYISHETIYKYVWADKASGGNLYRHLRGSQKRRRKRYRSYDSRGQLAGKRNISERPQSVENRSTIGHLEGDTVMGGQDQHCILTLVDRKSGYLLIGKLKNRTKKEVVRCMSRLINKQHRRVKTITVDNGTEFHAYKDIEKATGSTFYFANPYHSWERGTNENTNGLIRQYLPKRQSMEHLTQSDCDRIAKKLNTRPRKRLGFKTPEECYVQ